MARDRATAPRARRPPGCIAGWSILVTGGGSGIGLATAERLAADGAHVTICGRTEQKLADASGAHRQPAATGGATARYVVADVTVEEQVAAAVAATAEATGRIDGLFACAGGLARTSARSSRADVAAVRATIDLNLMGSVICVKQAAAAMQAQGGPGLHRAHVLGRRPLPPPAPLGLRGVEGGHLLPDRDGRRGARARSASGSTRWRPGIIDDELMAFITAGGPLLDDYLAQMPLGRVGTVEDVAAAVRYLIGPESSFVTGETLGVDGGHHLRRGADYSLLFGG